MEFGKPLMEQINERFSTNFSDSFGGDLSGYRSPTNYFNNNGVGSPSQNRSVREIEEQMTTLRKENFNLKLRIYFLEEKMPELYRMSSPEGQESLMKKFVDNKVEIEILSKDLEDKQQLLKEAGEAITHMENVQKDTETRYKQIIEELNQKIQCLEFENESLENCSKNDEMIMNELIGRSNIDNNKVDMMQKIRELEGYVKEADEKITNLNHHIKNLEEIITTKEKTINEYDKDLKDSNFEKNELNEQLESKEKTLIETEKKLFKMEYDFNELKKKDKQVNNLEELVEMLKYENRKLKNDYETQKIVAEENHATIKEQQLALNDMKSSLARKRKTVVHLSEKLKDSEKDCIKHQRHLEKEIDELRTILQNFKESQRSYDFHNRKNKSDKLSKKSQTTTTTTTLNYNRSYFWNPLFNASSSNININIPNNNTEKLKYFEDYRLKEKVSVYFNNYNNNNINNNNNNNNNNNYCNNMNNNNTKNKDAEINNKHRNIKNISKKLKLNFKENNLKILYNKNDRFKDCISLDDFNNDESAAIAAAATAAAASNQNNFNILTNDQLTNTSSILLNNSKYNFGIPSLFTHISTAVRGTKSESNITDFSYFYDKNFYSFCYETEFDKRMTEINNSENCFSSLNSSKYRFKNSYINNNNNNELQIMNGIDNEIDYPKIFDDEYLRKQISSEFKVNFTSYGKLLIQVIIITIFLVGLSALSSKNNSHQ